jgi:type IV pilus assembly protein PilM
MHVPGANQPIGIDISGGELFAAQMLGGVAPRLRHVVHSRLPEPPPQKKDARQQLADTLRDAVAHGFKGRRASLLLPHAIVFSAPLRFHVRAAESMEAVLIQEAAKVLPYPVEEALLDYPSLVGPPMGVAGQYEATIVAARRADVEHYLAAASDAGLTVEAVDFAASTLLRLHRTLDSTVRTAEVLVYVGRRTSLVIATTASHLLAYRTVDWGLAPLLESLLAKLQLGDEVENAAYMLSEFGLGLEGRTADDVDGATEIRRTVSQVCAPMVDELLRTLFSLTGYVRSQPGTPPFERLALYGFAGVVRGIGDYIGSRIDIPTMATNGVADLSPAGGRQGAADDLDLAGASLALGLSLRRLPWL